MGYPIHPLPLNYKRTEKLKGKYVFIGTSATGLSDFVATPFSPTFPGVEVHATIIDNLLSDDPMANEKYTEIGLTYVFIIIAGFFMIIDLVRLSPLTVSATVFCLISSVFLGNYFMYFLQN
jgi:adenylate cyclase